MKLLRRGWVFVICLAGVVVYGTGFWVFWHSLGTGAYGRPSVGTAIKDYYLGDQFAYLGIAANVEHGRSAFLDPYTASGHSIYPSGYFWVLGHFARSFETTVFAAWNVVGMAVDGALFVGAAVFAWLVSRNRWAWLLGPIPAIIGTYQYWTIGNWQALYGIQAVLWPAAASLFSPGAEPPALLLAGIALALLSFESRTQGRTRLAVVSGAGIAVGLTLHVHTYVAVFAATTSALWFLVRSCQTSMSRGTGLVLAAEVAATIALVALVPEAFPIVRVVVIVVAALLATVINPGARKQLGSSVGVFSICAGATAMPILVRISAQIGDKQSFLYLRQASGVATNLSLPLRPVLFHSAPALLLAIGCLAHLRRSRATGNSDDEGWSAALIAIIGAGALLVFNESWGLQQEPYRFLPYSQFLLAAFAIPWLARRPVGSTSAAVLVRGGVVLALAATAPTMLLFVRGTPAILQSPEEEQRAFQATANALPANGVALLDSCLPRGAYKALTGARVVGINEGLAYPRAPQSVRTVLALQRAGVLPDGSTLDSASVTSFVTIDGCNGPTALQLERRFGKPIRRVQLAPPRRCGLRPLEMRVYLRPADEHGSEERFSATPDEPAVPESPLAPCSLSSRRSDLA